MRSQHLLVSNAKFLWLPNADLTSLVFSTAAGELPHSCAAYALAQLSGYMPVTPDKPAYNLILYDYEKEK